MMNVTSIIIASCKLRETLKCYEGLQPIVKMTGYHLALQMNKDDQITTSIIVTTQAEDGNKVELTGCFSTALRGSLYCNFAITNV